MPWKKLSLTLLILLIVSQLPFACRRYRLGRLNTLIQQLNSQRVLPPSSGNYREYKGVIHVHSFLGGHSSGSFDEIIAAAKANELQFVIMTEHPGKELNTAELTLKGRQAGILFVNGNEVITTEGDRLLVFPGSEETGKAKEHSTHSILEATRKRSQLSIVAYPEEFKSWATDNYDGVELYNVFTNTKRINPVVMFFDGLWSLSSYHDLLFANFYGRPNQSLQQWDQANRKRKVIGLAGNDAHANVGLSLADSSGKPILGVRLDPYETSFRLVRVHLLVPATSALDEKVLLDALSQGHAFIGFDLFGDSSGFSFSASNSMETRVLGDEIALTGEVRLIIFSPLPARIVLFKDGETVPAEESLTTRREFVVKEAGAYRVEAYLPQLNHRVGQEPWVISNPIYVKQ